MKKVLILFICLLCINGKGNNKNQIAKNIVFIYPIATVFCNTYLNTQMLKFMELENRFLIELIKRENIDQVYIPLDKSTLLYLSNYTNKVDSTILESDLILSSHNYLIDKIKLLVQNGIPISNFYIERDIERFDNYARYILLSCFIVDKNDQFKAKLNYNSIKKSFHLIVSDKKFSKSTATVIDKLIRLLVKINNTNSMNKSDLDFLGNLINEGLLNDISNKLPNKYNVSLKDFLIDLRKSFEIKCKSPMTEFNIGDEYFMEIKENKTKNILYLINDHIYSNPNNLHNVREKLISDTTCIYNAFRFINTPFSVCTEIYDYIPVKFLNMDSINLNDREMIYNYRKVKY